jgi:hypothetical protein
MVQASLINPSDDVLDRLPVRAFTFLSALSTSRPIFALMVPRGLTKAELAEGWEKLHAVSGFVAAPSTPTVDVDPNVHAALAEIDAWDEPNFAVTKAALALDFPSAYAFLMDGLAAAKGYAAVQGVGIYLRRLDALEKGKGRDKDEHKSDKAAVTKLGTRGITPAVRKHLKELVALVEGGPEDEDATAAPAPDPIPAARRAALVELYGWFFNWSETARAVTGHRRDYLIRLGLAQRKVKKKSTATGGGATGGGATGGATNGGATTGGATGSA